jgi:hypothetical protein
MPDKITGLTAATEEVFEQVSQLECIKGLFLCGGTGQSLQVNHRLSEDLDFELSNSWRNKGNVPRCSGRNTWR